MKLVDNFCAMHALLCMLGILLGTAGSASKGAAIPSYQDQCSDGSVGKICSTHRRIQRRSSAPVILDHDGNYDDILVLLVLLNFRPAVDLKAVLVTPADCELEPAVDVSSTVLSMFGHDAPVLPGNFPARFNEFPRVWRELASEMQQVADIYLHAASSRPKPAVTAEEWLADYLLKAENKTDFVITGPATNLASTLKQHPELIRKVGTVLWMGGAVDVNGNVRDDDQRPQESDGTAEWNAFWDPEATRDLLKLGLDLRLVPLDATDDVPVTKDFIRRLDPTLEVARTARQIWAQSKFQKSNAVYYMWDTLTVGLYLRPDLCTWEELRLRGWAEGHAQGRTERAEDAPIALMATNTDVSGFTDFLLDVFNNRKG